MPEIVLSSGRKALKAFFSLSVPSGYSGKEAAYIERHFSGGMGKSAYLLALDRGKAVARAMTWQGETLKNGYFALLDGRRDAFEALLGYMEQLQRKWGSTSLTGPVTPDGSGFFMGQCDSASDGSARGELTGPFDAGQSAALLQNGYDPVNTLAAFRLCLQKTNPYRGAAQKIASRLGIKPEKAKLNVFDQNLERAVFALETEDKAAALRQLLWLKPSIAKDRSFVVNDPCGRPLAYAISLKGDIPRLATFWTKDDEYRRPCALLLCDALFESCQKAGISEIELSLIDTQNEASMRLCGNAGARLSRQYKIYNKNLT